MSLKVSTAEAYKPNTRIHQNKHLRHLNKNIPTHSHLVSTHFDTHGREANTYIGDKNKLQSK